MGFTREEYNRKMAEIKEFMNARRLPLEMKGKLNNFYSELYDSKTVFEDKKILQELPSHMRREVITYLYEELIKNSFFFSGLDEFMVPT